MAIKQLYPCFKHWDKQTVWIYSDPHFGDKDLRAGIPDRPPDADQIKMINSKVGRKDTLIILGDIGDIECAKQLRGYKILIAGNHDAGLSNYEDVFDEVYGGPVMISERVILSHEPITTPWAFNIHGHDHVRQVGDGRHLNVCSDVIGYTPINLNQFYSSGALAKIDSIHRDTIDKATAKKKKREHKKASRI